ncbi:MAG: hypothetical protein LC790_11840, partial [Actinobacteria bacterium]|nr:hypothetical protein [Actinomycetota bacterium]
HDDDGPAPLPRLGRGRQVTRRKRRIRRPHRSPPNAAHGRSGRPHDRHRRCWRGRRPWCWRAHRGPWADRS